MDMKAFNKSCSNFLSFSCGKFQNQLIHERYGDQKKEGNELDFRIYKFMQFFEEYQSDLKVFNEAKKFFNLCMDEAKLVEMTYEPVLKIIHELGGWNQNTTGGWEELHNAIFRIGITQHFLINFRLDPDQIEPERYSIFIETPDSHILGGNVYDFLEDQETEQLKSYYNYMVDTYKTLYSLKIDEKLEATLNETFRFEKLFIRAMHGRMNDDRYDEKEEEKLEYTIAQLQENFTSMNWLNFFKTRLGMTENEQLDMNTRINVENPWFIANLDYLLKNQTDLTVKNFLIWKALDHITAFLPRKLKDARGKLLEEIYQVLRFSEQWDNCMKETSKLFSVVVAKINAEYYKNKFGNEIHEKFGKLDESLTESLKEVLGEKELNLTKEEFENLSSYIDSIQKVNPVQDEIFTVSTVDDYYKDLKIDSKDNYYDIILKMRKFKSRRNGFLRYKTPVRDTIWETHLDIIETDDGSFITSHFDPDKNYIYIGPNDLTPPNFDVTYPDYLNYGGAGYEIFSSLFNLILPHVSY